MRKNNKWTLGKHHFVVPHLPENLRGRHGCSLHLATFDPAVGEEVYALYREEPDYVDQYRHVVPFNLLVHTGLIRTPYGVVAFIVWQIAASSPQEVLVEQYLNPHEISALRIVSSAANQTHFILLVINNQNSEISAFVDFENSFGFEKLASGMVSAIGHETAGNFPAATNHVMRSMTISDLIASSALGFVANS